MKKRMWFGGYAAILALAVIACEGILPPAGSEAAWGNEPVEYTDDGRALVNLTINTGGEGGKARALTTDIAKAAINYYEVMFYDGTNYYRAAGYTGPSSLRLRVPADTYKTDSSGKYAVVLAGSDQNNIKTLLAMGKLTTPADGVITPGTTSVTFTLTALTAEVSADVSSAFKVTTGAPPVSYATAQYNSILVPCFYVQKNFTNAQATYTIGGFNTSAGASEASMPKTFGDLLVVTARGVNTWAVASDSIFNQNVAKITNAIVLSPASGSNIPSNGEITLQFNTPDADCTNLISFVVQVSALAANVPGGYSWWIRGGLKHHLPDTGASTSGGILLIIGSGPLTVGTTWS